MALAYSDRRSTRDIGAIFEPKAVVYKNRWRPVTGQIDLPDDWLNDAAKSFAPGQDHEQAKSFAPGQDHEQRVVFTSPSLEVATSPRYLLAMKLLASRVDQDTEDIQAL